MVKIIIYKKNQNVLWALVHFLVVQKLLYPMLFVDLATKSFEYNPKFVYFL